MISQNALVSSGILLLSGTLLLGGAGCSSETSGPDQSASHEEIPVAPAEDGPSIAEPLSADSQSLDHESKDANGPAPAPEGMVWIPGGTFRMGNDKGQPDEAPEHEVTLDGFWIDRTEVTNRQFKEFTDATGYLTTAEKTPRREDFVGQVEDIEAIPAENLVAGSICFNPDFDPKTLKQDHPLWMYQVWQYVHGANWRHPRGPDSSIDDLLDHPVVHVSWDDAVAYCDWAGKRLPTEAEYEYAARGGLEGQEFCWGDEKNPDGQWMCNIWQGVFPFKNRNEDSYEATAPVGSFPPNGYGLYDMSGNVWEWCSDLYRPDYYAQSPRQNPFGPTDSFDPLEPGLVKRVQRGGSFMCSDNYCLGYRVAARMKGTPDTGTFHAGFRCVLTPEMRKVKGEE